MPIMRNPFRSKDENQRPATSGGDKFANDATTKPIAIQERAPAEYKLSEINDSGVFVPPSPTEERKSFWTTSSSRSTTSSRSIFDQTEQPFNISRESFDSYRRSFDISARSPVLFAERTSLDSRTSAPRHSNSFHRPLQVPGTQTEEEADALEDIALDDPKPAPHKKRGVFSRIMDSESHPAPQKDRDGAARSSWHHFGGRKRGQSGQGAELGDFPRREETPRPEGQGRREERLATPQPQAQATAGAEQSSQAPVITVDGAS